MLLVADKLSVYGNGPPWDLSVNEDSLAEIAWEDLDYDMLSVPQMLSFCSLAHTLSSNSSGINHSAWSWTKELVSRGMQWAYKS